jgi:TRAP transporter TAXI family solute receptor
MALAVTALATTAGQASELLIGTGARSSVEHQVARALCRLINRASASVTCTPMETPGPLFNLGNVRNGAIELGLARSDWHYHAVKQSGPFAFADEDFTELRSLFSLYIEAFTVVVRRDAALGSFDQLNDLRVNIGAPGSLPRTEMEAVMAVTGWQKEDFPLAEELPSDQQSLALCHGRIQAGVYTVSHPYAALGQTIELCDAVLTDVSAAVIAKLVATSPFYVPTEIPQGLYVGQTEPTRTFGLPVTVVASAEVPADTVHALLSAIFADLEQLRQMHPVLVGLEPSQMLRDGLTAPLHDGAERYARERGWH